MAALQPLCSARPHASRVSRVESPWEQPKLESKSEAELKPELSGEQPHAGRAHLDHGPDGESGRDPLHLGRLFVILNGHLGPP